MTWYDQVPSRPPFDPYVVDMSRQVQLQREKQMGVPKWISEGLEGKELEVAVRASNGLFQSSDVEVLGKLVMRLLEERAQLLGITEEVEEDEPVVDEGEASEEADQAEDEADAADVDVEADEDTGDPTIRSRGVEEPEDEDDVPVSEPEPVQLGEGHQSQAVDLDDDGE